MLSSVQSTALCRYITNCGTEGNLHGILVGRENLPDGERPSRSQPCSELCCLRQRAADDSLMGSLQQTASLSEKSKSELWHLQGPVLNCCLLLFCTAAELQAHRDQPS